MIHIFLSATQYVVYMLLYKLGLPIYSAKPLNKNRATTGCFSSKNRAFHLSVSKQRGRYFQPLATNFGKETHNTLRTESHHKILLSRRTCIDDCAT